MNLSQSRVSFESLCRPDSDVVQNKTHADTFVDLAGDYLDKHCIWDLFNNLMQKIAIERPVKPLDFLIDELQRPRETLRVLILGSSDAGKTTLSDAIVRQFGLVYMTVKELLCSEVERESDIGLKAKDFVERNEDLPDELCIELLKAAISSDECKRQGWIIEGFPLNRKQGSAMLRSGILPNKIVFLDTCEKVAASQALEHSDTTYFQSINSTLDLFKESMMIVRADSDDDDDDIFAKVNSFLCARKTHCRTPMVAPRIVCIGSPSSGCTTHSKQLALELGLQRISPADILHDQELKCTEIGKLAIACRTSGDSVSDKIISSLVRDKLLSINSNLHGWVLDGFPVNKVQADALQMWGVVPSRCIVLDTEEQVLISRISRRRIDPITNKVYHLDDNPPPSGEVAERCIQRRVDEEEQIKERLKVIDAGVCEVKTEFAQMVHQINCTESIELVYEKLKKICVSPTHKQAESEQ